jgi:hypothetical protein
MYDTIKMRGRKLMLQCVLDYFSLAESVFVIIGVFLIIKQIKQQTKISRADHDRLKKQSTIEFYNALSTESYQFLDNIKGKTLDYASVNHDEKLRKNVIRYLSRLERLAIGVASDVYDFQVLCLMSGRYLTKKYNQFEKYIKEAREHKNAPTLYKEFELLVVKIEKYRDDHPEQTAHNSKSSHVMSI